MTYKDDVKDLKQYYKLVYRCKECKKAYGSDEEDNTSLCPLCEKKK